MNGVSVDVKKDNIIYITIDYHNLLLLIEVNDKSHNTPKRIERDHKVKKITSDLNVKLITFYTNYPNKKEYVLNRIINEIKEDQNTKQ